MDVVSVYLGFFLGIICGWILSDLGIGSKYIEYFKNLLFPDVEVVNKGIQIFQIDGSLGMSFDDYLKY
jgi:hypothetical protein